MDIKHQNEKQEVNLTDFFSFLRGAYCYLLLVVYDWMHLFLCLIRKAPWARGLILALWFPLKVL